MIDGTKVLIICEISLHISSHLIQTATICKTRQGPVGGIVGPGYSSSGTFWGLLNVSLRASGAELGLGIVVHHVLSVLKVTPQKWWVENLELILLRK